VSGIFYGWHGNYSSWDEARKRCSGYDSGVILEKVKSSMLLVKDGSYPYERDSVLFTEIQYSSPLLASLMWIAAKNAGKLHVLDFGGSLGSTYYQNKKFLDSLHDVMWFIVEQPHFVNTGKEHFEEDKLKFFYSVEECLDFTSIDVVLLSSVLQYLEKPFNIIDKLKSKGISYILIDRTPFTKGKDRITVQKVNPWIYKASYPCWFFNKERFIEEFIRDYKMIFEFDALDKANIRSEFKGYLFERCIGHDSYTG